VGRWSVPLIVRGAYGSKGEEMGGGREGRFSSHPTFNADQRMGEGLTEVGEEESCTSRDTTFAWVKLVSKPRPLVPYGGGTKAPEKRLVNPNIDLRGKGERGNFHSDRRVP